MIAGNFKTDSESDRENLVLNLDFERYFIKVFTHNVVTQMDLQLFVGDKFNPYVDLGLFLDIADDWAELKILLNRLRLANFKTHRHIPGVINHQFLAVNMIQ